MEDRVNKPEHYQFPDGHQPIDIARYLTYNCGTALVYVARAGRKTEEGMTPKEKNIEDLKKAIWHINDEIARLEKE